MSVTCERKHELESRAQTTEYKRVRNFSRNPSVLIARPCPKYVSRRYFGGHFAEIGTNDDVQGNVVNVNTNRSYDLLLMYRFGDKAIENCDFSERYYVTFALCLSVT